MCATCGCGKDDGTTITNLQTGRHTHIGPDGKAYEHEHPHDHLHPHDQDHFHEPAHAHDQRQVLRLELDLLSKNNLIAERNRGWLAGRGILALNLMSAPGAGKTTLLERTIRELGSQLSIHVIEGDQATLRDAERIRVAGARVIQINTGAACHLDAAMIERSLPQLDPPAGALLLVENVGNLVCPAMFDLGEKFKVVVASVTEGDDKPAKYPHMFRAADVIVLNKIDLLPHVSFDVAAFERAARDLKPGTKIFQVSATRGDGLAAWFDWMHSRVRI